MKSAYALFLASIVGFAFLVNVGYAEKVDLNSVDFKELVSAYNGNLDKVPSFVKNTFGNERINLYVDGQPFVGLVGQNGNITEYKKGGIENPTMRIYTTSGTIDKLVKGNTTLLDSVKDKSIDYEGVGFAKKIKFGFIKLFQGLFFHG